MDLPVALGYNGKQIEPGFMSNQTPDEPGSEQAAKLVRTPRFFKEASGA